MGRGAQADRPLQLLIAATLALCCVAPLLTALSRSGRAPPDAYLIFQRLFFFNDYFGSLAMLLAVVLMLGAGRVQELVIALAAAVGRHPARTAGAAFVVLALCSRFVYMAHPLAMDEYAPYLQAHAFARSELTVHYPPELIDWIVPRPFQGGFIPVDKSTGEAASVYWAGLALVMAPFAKLGLAWCVNPLFAALALLVLHRLACDAAGDAAAGGWTMLAALASPQFTVEAISFYAMPGELALTLLFVWLLLKPQWKYALAAGLAGGMAAVMHNPAPHSLVAAPCLLWLACDRRRWHRLAAVLAGYLPAILVLGLGWSAVTAAVGAGPGPSVESAGRSVGGILSFIHAVLRFPTDDMLTARWYATWKMWIWSCPGLMLLMFLARPRPLAERLLLAGLATTYVFYLFVLFDQGHGWGYRYIHSAWAALPLAGGLWIAAASPAGRRWGAAIIAAGALATPVFMWQTHATIQDALSYRITPEGSGDWVVFVAQDTGRYRGDIVQNVPGPSRVLYLASKGNEKDRALIAQRFPGARLEQQDRRGSAWRVHDGVVSRLLQTGRMPQTP